MSDAKDKTLDLPEPQRFATVLDAVLEIRSNQHTATDFPRNLTFFSATHMHSSRFASFRNAVAGTLAEGLKQDKLEEALEVVICHCVQLGWQAAKYDSGKGCGPA